MARDGNTRPIVARCLTASPGLPHCAPMKIRACFWLPLLLAGCGGNVVVDPVSVEPAELACADLCDAVEAACPSTSQGCSPSCPLLDKAGESACADSYKPFLECVIASAGSTSFCGSSGACEAEIDAFLTCLSDACQVDPTICQP